MVTAYPDLRPDLCRWKFSQRPYRIGIEDKGLDPGQLQHLLDQARLGQAGSSKGPPHRDCAGQSVAVQVRA